MGRQASIAVYCPEERHHLLDHLAPLADILKLPLFVESDVNHELLQRYYPTVQVERMRSLDHLVSEFDGVISSTAWPPLSSWLFETIYRKQFRLIFCPHGHSDKEFSLSHYPLHDLLLLYGPLHRELLQKVGVWPHVKQSFEIGNYRLPYYLENKSFYDRCVDEDIFQNLPERSPTLLYAPTWRDPESSTSFFDHGHLLLEELPDHWNLIVKLHPALEAQDPARIVSLTAQYEGKPNIRFITQFPPIYPLLARIDAYLGDSSSINYDLLAFQKPMFFLKRPSRLSVAGFTCEEGPLFPQIERLIGCTPKESQADLFEQAFGPWRSIREIRKSLSLSLQIPMGEEL